MLQTRFAGKCKLLPFIASHHFQGGRISTKACANLKERPIAEQNEQDGPEEFLIL